MNAALAAPWGALIAKLKPRNDDDFVDRLFYVRTPTILFIFALIIGAKQLVGQPIQCWPPKEFKGEWMKYAEGFCFVENTYYVATDERFPIRAVEREHREIHYYQWVPFVLIGQALLLMAPKLLWNAFNWKSGLDIRSLIRRAEQLTEAGEFEGKLKAGRELADRLGHTIEQSQRKQTKNGWPMAHHVPKVPEHVSHERGVPCPSVNFVTGIYLLLKLSNLLMVLFQLHLLTKFLGHTNDDGSYWGWSVVRDLMAGRNWRQSGAFPRETFCDFEIRQPSPSQSPLRYTLQCVLMINMFNEKIFLFLWFWLVGLAAVGLSNLLVWLYRALNWSSMEQFVLVHLRLATADLPQAFENQRFVRHGLSRDGVTALRLIALNCEPTMCALLVLRLWRKYKQAVKIGQIKADTGRFVAAEQKQKPTDRNMEQSMGTFQIQSRRRPHLNGIINGGNGQEPAADEPMNVCGTVKMESSEDFLENALRPLFVPQRQQNEDNGAHEENRDAEWAAGTGPESNAQAGPSKIVKPADQGGGSDGNGNTRVGGTNGMVQGRDDEKWHRAEMTNGKGEVGIAQKK